MPRLWLFLAFLLVGTACSSSPARASCGPILREPLDAGSSIHVLPTATDVDYASDPPTSGPHQPVPSLSGLKNSPLPRPIQVGVIEGGGILVQYDPEVVVNVSSFVRSVDDPLLLVAPNPDLDDPIVVTAWTAKQTCSALDADAAAAFIEERRGQAPGSDR